MKLNTSNKLTVIALSVSTLIGGLGMSGAASAALGGDTSGIFTARVNVVSDQVCTLNVTQPTDKVFQAKWTANTASDTSAFSELTTSEPLEVEVKAVGATSCTLNNVKITTAVNNATALAPGGNSAALVAFGSSGGSWVVMPFVARAQYFTDDNYTTAGAADVTLHTAVGGDTEVVRATASEEAGTSARTTSIGGPSFDSGYLMAASYVNAQLTTNALGDTTTATFSAPETYKSAKFGISARIGSAPVDGAGAIDRKLAANGDVVNMPFTVTITEA